nr:unnamed protein product [Digitaria exilis]
MADDAAKMEGFLKSSEMAHSTVEDELSVPPTMRSWHVHHVPRHEALPLAPPPLGVLVDDVVETVQPWDPVADVEHAIEQHQLVHHPLELGHRRHGTLRHRRAIIAGGVEEPLAKHHPGDDVHAERGHVVPAELHDAPRRGKEATHKGAHLVGADGLERREPAGAEELGGADAARVAPVRAVGRPRDVGVVVGGVLAGGRPGSVEEEEVVG